MSHAFARTVSVIGHPTVVLPLAVLAPTLRDGPSAQSAWALSGFLVLAALVMGYSKWQVRRGRWSHVDASAPEERRALNGFLLLALGTAVAMALALGAPRELTLGLALSAGVVLVAIGARSHLKLSLHMAFVVLAAALLGTASAVAVLAGLVFAGLVAWSRLHLERHQPRDIVAGAATGAVAGMLFHAATWYWAR